MRATTSLSCPGSATFKEMSSPSHAHRRMDPDEGPVDQGPFRASQIREGDPYELSNGHPIRCMGAGGRHGLSNTQGAMVINSDPGLVQGAGVDVGFEFNGGKNLRAPDIAAGNLTDKPGWAKGVPPLAVEYADVGQDEGELKDKIKELLAAGTRYVWVVRLVGPLRVEVHRPGKRKVVVAGDKELLASGVLTNPVPVRSLVERGAANQATLRNLLNQMGYESLEAVRDEGRSEGLAAGRSEGLATGRSEGLATGRSEGLAAGRSEGLRQAVYTACALLNIRVSRTMRTQIERMDAAALLALCEHLQSKRAWPSSM